MSIKYYYYFYYYYYTDVEEVGDMDSNHDGSNPATSDHDGPGLDPTNSQYTGHLPHPDCQIDQG